MKGERGSPGLAGPKGVPGPTGQKGDPGVKGKASISQLRFKGEAPLYGVGEFSIREGLRSVGSMGEF